MHPIELRSVWMALAVVMTVAGCADDESGAPMDAGHMHSHDGGDHDSGGHHAIDAAMAHDSGHVDDDAGGDDTAVEVAFEARVGAEAFDCTEQYLGLGSDDATLAPLDFRLYVQNVRLLTEDGEQPIELEQDGIWQHEQVALLDFEDDTGTCLNGTTETRTKIVGTRPAGEYTGIAFEIGVPEALNHADPAAAPSPLNLTALHWNWAAGYKFARIDFRVLDDDEDGGAGGAAYNFHLGSTMCTGDPTMSEAVTCARSNRPTIVLDGFDPATQKIVIDYARLVENEVLGTEAGGAPGCMFGGADGDCGPLFIQLGMSLATGMSDGVQHVFSVVAK